MRSSELKPMLISTFMKSLIVFLNNAGKSMWLSAQTTNQKLKQNAQTQDADGMQAFVCAIYDTVISQQTYSRLRIKRPPYKKEFQKLEACNSKTKCSRTKLT